MHPTIVKIGPKHPYYPLSGICGVCGQPWSHNTDSQVAIESFALEHTPIPGLQLKDVITKLQASFLDGKTVVSSFKVTNYRYRNTSYDPHLTDYDIWEEIDPIGERSVSLQSYTEADDFLRVILAYYYHLSCADKAKYMVGIQADDSFSQNYIRRNPNSGLFEYVRERHEAPYTESGGHFDSIDVYTPDPISQIGIELLFRGIVGTEEVIHRGKFSLYHLHDYLQIGAPWDPDEAVASGRDEYSLERFLSLKITFVAGKIVNIYLMD